MIEGVTLTTTTKYVNSHPEEVDALLRSLVDALHYFKTNKQGTLKIINETCRGLLRMQSDDELEAFYDECAKIFEKKPYPRPEAIQNVFQLGVHDTPESGRFQSAGDVGHASSAGDRRQRLYRQAVPIKKRPAGYAGLFHDGEDAMKKTFQR